MALFVVTTVLAFVELATMTFLLLKYVSSDMVVGPFFSPTMVGDLPLTVLGDIELLAMIWPLGAPCL